VRGERGERDSGSRKKGESRRNIRSGMRRRRSFWWKLREVEERS
jgi:hypothetical protein